MRQLLSSGALALCLSSVAAFAGPFADFESDLRDAYGAYRAALFQSNAGNAAATTEAMAAFSSKWDALSATWGTEAPPQYADDARFGETLSAVASIADSAAAQVAGGDLAAAHLTLEEVREAIGALHDRNGIVTFSDRMNAYHAKMEEVLALDPAALTADDMPMVVGEAAVLAYLANDIAAHPAPEAEDEAYAPLLAAFLSSVGTFDAAARTGDVETVRAAIGGLKVPYSKLFAKFG